MFLKFKTVDGKTYYLNQDCFTFLDCGDGYFYINEIKIRHRSVLNIVPYCEFLGTIVREEDHGYQAVTNNITPPPEFRENAWYRMIFVHVPNNMKEWLGYWTGKDWILVERLTLEDQQPDEMPNIIRTTEISPPTNQISFALFAETGKNFYIVQAFDKKGIPLIMFLQDVPSNFPFRVLPRNVLPVEGGGSAYAFDYRWFHMEH